MLLKSPTLRERALFWAISWASEWFSQVYFTLLLILWPGTKWCKSYWHTRSNQTDWQNRGCHQLSLHKRWPNVDSATLLSMWFLLHICICADPFSTSFPVESAFIDIHMQGLTLPDANEKVSIQALSTVAICLLQHHAMHSFHSLTGWPVSFSYRNCFR